MSSQSTTSSYFDFEPFYRCYLIPHNEKDKVQHIGTVGDQFGKIIPTVKENGFEVSGIVYRTTDEEGAINAAKTWTQNASKNDLKKYKEIQVMHYHPNKSVLVYCCKCKL